MCGYVNYSRFLFSVLVSGCGSTEVWLCGRTFTAADLNVTILILRLEMLGLVSRYFTPRRPNLCEYNRRLMERPPAKKLSKMGGTLAKTLMKKACMQPLNLFSKQELLLRW